MILAHLQLHDPYPINLVISLQCFSKPSSLICVPSPRRSKVDDIAGKLLRMFPVMKVAGVVDDEHACTQIFLRNHIEQCKANSQNRRGIILSPVEKCRGLQFSLLDPLSHLRRSLGNNHLISFSCFSAHSRIGLFSARKTGHITRSQDKFLRDVLAILGELLVCEAELLLRVVRCTATSASSRAKSDGRAPLLGRENAKSLAEPSKNRNPSICAGRSRRPRTVNQQNRFSATGIVIACPRAVHIRELRFMAADRGGRRNALIN